MEQVRENSASIEPNMDGLSTKNLSDIEEESAPFVKSDETSSNNSGAQRNGSLRSRNASRDLNAMTLESLQNLTHNVQRLFETMVVQQFVNNQWLLESEAHTVLERINARDPSISCVFPRLHAAKENTSFAWNALFKRLKGSLESLGDTQSSNPRSPSSSHWNMFLAQLRGTFLDVRFASLDSLYSLKNI